MQAAISEKKYMKEEEKILSAIWSQEVEVKVLTIERKEKNILFYPTT